MPKRIGLRDDDVLGRLDDLERRMAAAEDRVDPKGTKYVKPKPKADEE